MATFRPCTLENMLGASISGNCTNYIQKKNDQTHLNVRIILRSTVIKNPKTNSYNN